MKRTPLRRKTKLKKVSDKHSKRLERYLSMLRNLDKANTPCARCNNPSSQDFHHPYGHGGDNFYRGVLLCRDCHDWIHSRANEAYEHGWLQPEYRGFPPNPNHPKPWNPAHCIDGNTTL